MLIHLAHIIHSLTRLVRRHLLQHFAPSRPRAAAFTKRGAIMYERSQRLRCYRWRHEYSKTRGSRVNGHRQRSIAPRREWSDRHFMNREPSLIDLSVGRRRRCRSGARRTPDVGSGARRRKWRPPNMAARAQEVRSLPIGTSAPRRRERAERRAGCARPHAAIPTSAKVRAIANLRINYSRCYLKIFVCVA